MLWGSRLFGGGGAEEFDLGLGVRTVMKEGEGGGGRSMSSDGLRSAQMSSGLTFGGDGWGWGIMLRVSTPVSRDAVMP